MGQDANMQSLDESLIDLNNTLNKDEGIVNTSSAHRYLNQPEDIEAEYVEYARTHLVQPDIDRFISSLLSGLNDPNKQKSIPGYIVGPYGFGKTSTAGKVWYVLDQEENYIATPPIYFDELQSIVDAVYGWMRYRLQDREEYLEELERIYETKARNNVEDVLDQTDLENKEDVQEEFERLIETGSIDIEFSVTHVLEFLSECNQIAREAGYNGLVVIADELQQFVSNHASDKEAYSELRDIAKNIALGLNEGDGLGLLFTMDDGLHSDLDVNADDVLARLAEQNVQLNLSNVYDRSFPTKLWDDLSETFNFYDQRHEVISKDALDAIGQICERGPPLSNGPRTVVDILTIAIDHRLSENDIFDALDLANAYYTGVVRFKGDHIKKAITEGINADLINSQERENFIKLCGVFPRGISDDLLRDYGVHGAKEDVKSELHGQIIITHEEGRTLKRLEREGEERGIKDELFTQFYRDYDTTDIYDANAAEVFRDEVLSGELFPSTRGNSLSSWKIEHEFEPETGGVYTAIFRGSFNGQKYPDRIIEIRTGPSRDVVKSPDSGHNVDMTLGFVCNLEKDTDMTPHIERPEPDEAILFLDFADAFDSLPSNIALLEDYMSPEDVNPHLLLALHHFMVSWEENRTINPNQEDQLEYIRDQLINQSIQKLFGSPLNGDDFISEGESSRRTTQATKVVPEVFQRIIQDLYPDYTTLFVSDKYSTFLEDYESLLLGNDPDIRISQKRGNTPLEGSKDEITNALGVSNKSTAKTRLDKQFETLTDIDVWSGQDARIRLVLHPLEKLLKDEIENKDDEQLAYQEAYELGKKHGHRSEEVDWALRLLDARDYIVRHPEEEYAELSDIAIDYDEVQKRFDSIEERAAKVDEFSDSWDQYDDIKSELSSIEDRLEDTSNEDIEILDGILADLQDIENKITARENGVHATYLERCRSKKQDLQELASSTHPRELSKTAEGSNVPFAMHLSDINTGLNTDFKQIQNDAEEVESELREKIESADGTTSVNSIDTLKQAHNTAADREAEIEERFEGVNNTAQDYAEWCDLAADMGETRNQMVRYRDSHDDSSRVESLLEQLDQQLQTIQTGFQKDEDDILRDAGIHRDQFEDIEDEFNGITQSDEDVFTYRKRVLENTIRDATEGHPSIRQNLNPNNAQGSRNDLHHEFKRQLTENTGGLNDINSSVEKVQDSLEYAKLLNQIPTDPDQDPEEIREELSGIQEKIDAVKKAVRMMDVKDDIPLPDDQEDQSGPLYETDDVLVLEIDDRSQEAGASVESQRERVDELQDVVSEWRQSTERPPEGLQHIMNELDYRERKNVESVLISIADKSEEELSLGEFFDNLQELFEGNHITISLKSEHR